MVNLFAYIDTNRVTFYDAADPVGPENDKYLLKSAKRCDKVIVAWGYKGTFFNKVKIIMNLLRKNKIRTCCLMENVSGQPSHP